MATFSLQDSERYYLTLSDNPKRFDADSPVTNVFFDDTNGQVFTVRSGGVAGVTVVGSDDTKSITFRMEDKGPIMSIKFSPDHKILAIQRNGDNQNATVDFINFKHLAPTNVEYSHTCRWKNAKILGFVWPKANEIAYITDHGIELLQVIPEKKQLKSLKNSSFSGAWFAWLASAGVVLVAGNNGALLQPFCLHTSNIIKLQKLELDSTRPVVERDVFLVRLHGVAWCAVFRHTAHHGDGGDEAASAAVHAPVEVWLLPVVGGAGAGGDRVVVRTGHAGRFALSVVDDLLVVHHQASQTSQVFDVAERACVREVGVGVCVRVHAPLLPARSVRPPHPTTPMCILYSVNWVVFQPDYIVDARLGCLWRLRLLPRNIPYEVACSELGRVTAALLRRTEGAAVVLAVLAQLVDTAAEHLPELTDVFDEINYAYRQWATEQLSRNTAGGELAPDAPAPAPPAPPITQRDVCAVLRAHHGHKYAVQVVTAYLWSLWRHETSPLHETSETGVRALVSAGRAGAMRLAMLVRRGALGDCQPLACQLLSLARHHPAAAQLALDMLRRLNKLPEIVEVLLSWEQVVAGVGAARAGGEDVWRALPPRKLLAAARAHSQPAFLAVYRALLRRNERQRGQSDFLKGEQCDAYVEYYRQLTEND